MFLREIAVAVDEQVRRQRGPAFVNTFLEHRCCITELYQHLASRRIKTSDDAKVVFVFSDAIDSPPAEVHPMRCYWPFEFSAYAAGAGDTKKHLIFAALHGALMWLADMQSWSLEPFSLIREEALDRNLVLEGFLKDSWPAPAGKHRARVHFRFELEAVRLEAVLTQQRAQSELSRRLLGTPKPYPGCVKEYAGDGGWISDTEFQLRSTGVQQQVWTVDFADVMA